MTVLAVILNYKCAALSCSCADRLRALGCASLDIAIVDNDSGVDVAEMAQYCRSNDVVFLRSEVNGGYSAGNNIGLRYAEEHGYEFALVINPDMEICDPSYIDKCVSKLREDPNIAVLGTDIVHVSGVRQNPMREPSYLEELLWPIELLRARLARRPLYHMDHEVSGYCQKVSGCCFFVRISFLREWGFLDEGVFLYCEEPILAARVAAAGFKEYYLHLTTAFHMHLGRRDLSMRNLEMLRHSREYYLREYSGYSGVSLKMLLMSKRIQSAALAILGAFR